jgi:hypothetical protein
MREREEHGRKERVKREISLGYCYKSDEREGKKRETEEEVLCLPCDGWRRERALVVVFCGDSHIQIISKTFVFGAQSRLP